MKKTVSIILILIMLFCFAGCKEKINENGDSIPQTEALSPALFKKILEKKDYVVDDYTESFNATYDEENSAISNSELNKYLVAANEGGISLEYMELDTEKTASKLYAKIVSNYDATSEDIKSIVDYSTNNYSKCIYKEDNYRSITKIKNTVILATGALDKADTIQQLLSELGY
jgi:hypothetical protein